MRYMLLIYGDDSHGPVSGTPEHDEMMQGYFALSRNLRAAGIDEPAEELDVPETATTVRIRDGETLLSDGPFVESKEYLGGFYIVNADGLDEAIAWAKQIPGARRGAIEIRPIIDHSA